MAAGNRRCYVPRCPTAGSRIIERGCVKPMKGVTASRRCEWDPQNYVGTRIAARSVGKVLQSKDREWEARVERIDAQDLPTIEQELRRSVGQVARERHIVSEAYDEALGNVVTRHRFLSRPVVVIPDSTVVGEGERRLGNFVDRFSPSVGCEESNAVRIALDHFALELSVRLPTTGLEVSRRYAVRTERTHLSAVRSAGLFVNGKAVYWWERIAAPLPLPDLDSLPKSAPCRILAWNMGDLFQTSLLFGGRDNSPRCETHTGSFAPPPATDCMSQHPRYSPVGTQWLEVALAISAHHVQQIRSSLRTSPHGSLAALLDLHVPRDALAQLPKIATYGSAAAHRPNDVNFSAA